MIENVALVCSALACILMVLSVIDSSEKMLKIQSLDCVANIVADVLLGGWTGIVLCLSGIVRNNVDEILEKFDIKVNKEIACYGLLGVCGIIALFTGSMYLVVCELVYTIAIHRGKGMIVESTLAISLMGWLIYDFSIGSYPMMVGDAIVLVYTIYKVSSGVEETGLFKVKAKGAQAGECECERSEHGEHSGPGGSGDKSKEN